MKNKSIVKIKKKEKRNSTRQFCSISVWIFVYLFFFLCAVSDSWPLSSSLSSDWLLLVLLEELLEEPLDESLATPVSSFTSIVSAKVANSGSLSLSTFNHFRDNFGLPRTCSRWIYYIICIINSACTHYMHTLRNNLIDNL